MISKIKGLRKIILPSLLVVLVTIMGVFFLGDKTDKKVVVSWRFSDRIWHVRYDPVDFGCLPPELLGSGRDDLILYGDICWYFLLFLSFFGILKQ